jgi:hypothetical protein
MIHVAGAQDPGALKALALHAEALATVRAFAERADALRVVLLVDNGEREEPAMLDRTADGTVELTHQGSAWTIPPATPVPAPPRDLPDIRPAPSSALRADPVTGELAAPIGAIANLGEAVLGLARAFGGRSVASAEFATHDPELPITIVARVGEPLLLAVGDGRFELPIE